MKYPPAPGFMAGMFSDRGRLYTFAASPPPEALDPVSVSSPDPWIALAATLEQAKRGNFLPVHGLVDLSTATSSPIHGRACVELTGDAGDRTALACLAQAMLNETDDEFLLDFCSGAKFGSVLWLAPYMLEGWIQLRNPRNRATFSAMISTVLEGPEGTRFFTDDRELSAQDYRTLVETEVARLEKEIGSDQEPVWGGELFSARRLASRMRNLILETEAEDDYKLGPMFLSLRHKFEASTGIDCSSFYGGEGHQFRPLAAQTIIEDFLESPKAAAYADGVRYFYGHRIPG